MFRVIERADEYADVVLNGLVSIPHCEWRAARRAKSALLRLRGAIECRLALGEPKSLAIKNGEDTEHAPECLLAHPAMTESNLAGLSRHFISD